MYFKDHIGYKMKVIFVGKDGSGKSSAIRYLTDNGENVQSTGTTTTNEVLASTELWFPFQTNDSDFNNTFSEEEQILCFELWNYSSNSKISRKCQDLAMSNTCVYIIISNMAEEDSLSGIIDSLNVVQTKAPGVPVTIVGTHSDDMVLDKRQEWLSSLQQVLQKCKVKQEEKIKEELEHLQQLNDTNTSIKLSSCRQNMSDLLKAISNIQTNMVCTSITTGKGFDELRRVITTTALSNGRWLNFKNKMNESTMSKLYNELHSLTTFGVILLTLDKFKNLAHTCDIHSCKDVSTTLEILREMGVVSYLAKYVDFPGNTPSCLPSIICINQASFQEVLHSIHLEDCTKAFKFESKRFWPKSSNDKRPDPLILVRAIEEIPTQGVIRECLFPLILQKFELTEEQILLIIEYLITLGILVLKEGTYNDEEDIQCLQLPHFPALSTKRCYYITWMENFPDIEPRLNWTSALFDGDLEIGIRYVFPFGIPDGFDDRLMCVCCQMCYRGRYKHHWKHGLLAKIDQVLIHLSSQRQQDSDEHIIVFTGRITVDEEEGERKATKVLWTQLAIVLHETEIYISQWPGLLRKVFIQPGPWYFEGEAPTQPVHIPLIDCFHFLDKGEDSLEISIDEQLFHVDLHELLPRTDDNKLNIVEWFDWLSSLESEYTQDSNTPIETFDVVGAGPLVVTTKMEQPTKNKGTVKWDLQGDNTNGQLKELSNVEFQTAVAKFVANIITQSFSKLALEMEQTKQGSTRIEEKSVSVLEKTLNRKSHSRRLSKSSTKSKTCEIL